MYENKFSNLKKNPINYKIYSKLISECFNKNIFEIKIIYTHVYYYCYYYYLHNFHVLLFWISFSEVNIVHHMNYS